MASHEKQNDVKKSGIRKQAAGTSNEEEDDEDGRGEAVLWTVTRATSAEHGTPHRRSRGNPPGAEAGR